MKTASEVKNSNRTRTLAHETRKNKQWLSMFVIAALVVAAVSTSCNNNGDEDEDENGSEAGVVTQITATVDNASQYSDVVKVKLNVIDSNIGCYLTLAESELKNGGFTLQLPGTVPERFLFPIDEVHFFFLLLLLDDELTYSDNNAKVLDLPYFIGYNSAGRHNSIFEIRSKYNSGTGAGSRKYYIYSDRDVNVSGSGTSPTDGGPDFVVSVDLKLKKGWNVYYSVTAPSPPFMNMEVRTSPAISGDWPWYIGAGVGDIFNDPASACL